MAKKRSRGTSRTKPRQEPVAPLGKWKSLLRKLSSPLGIVFASSSFVIAVGCAYFQFKAKLSVEPEPPLKSDSVIATPFRLTNESVLAIYYVKQEWLIEKGRVSRDFKRADETVEYREFEPLDPQPETIDKLDGSQSTTVYPFDNLSIGEVTGKRLKLMACIDYETAIFHWQRTESFVFEANEGTDHKFYWYHVKENTK